MKYRCKHFLLSIILLIWSLTGCTTQPTDITTIPSSVVTETTAEQKQDISEPISYTPTSLIDVIDVGQGLSVLIIHNGEALLYDTGTPDSIDNIKQALTENNVTTLKYVILSHPHEDHIGGFVEINNTYNIENILMPDTTSTTDTFSNIVTSIEQHQQSITVPEVGQEFTLGGATFTIIAPNNDYYNDTNDYSIGIQYIDYYANLILCGDASNVSEDEIVNNETTLNYPSLTNIYIVDHHGSKYSSSSNFINKINPQISIISVGAENDYGHPADETLSKLSNISTIYRTDLNGSIKINTEDSSVVTDKTLDTSNNSAVQEQT